MFKKSHYIVIGCILFGLFIFFSFLVHKNLFTTFDFDMTVRLQDHVSRRFDQPFSLLSMIGEFQFMAILLALILIFRKKVHGIIVFGLFGLFHIFELYGKTFVDHTPPPHFLLRTQLPFNFPQFYVSTENSYPSGHSGRAWFITITVGILVWQNKKLSTEVKLGILACLFMYDIVMMTSRVYLGEHWTSDVIGGMIEGAALALIGGAFL